MSDSDKRPELDDLSRRLREARGPGKSGGNGGGPRKGASTGAMALGLRLATELVAGVAVGALLGWGLDRWLGTSPILLVLFMILGAGAGFTNVIRAARQAEDEQGRNG